MPYRSDIAYIYDGSFAGLLCCVYESYYQKELPLLIFSQEQEQGTFLVTKEIITDEENAKKVESSIVQKISSEALEMVRLCYLSQDKNRENIVLNFLRLGYKVGSKVMDMLSHDTMRAIIKCAKSVGREAHLYKGFLRFSEHNGALVAIIEPQTFVLPMIIPHFCDRLSGEIFMIYDKTNKHIFIHQNGETNLMPLEHLELPPADETERNYRALWRRFYNTIAIEGRINPKLRMNLMPKKYWKHMTEFIEDEKILLGLSQKYIDEKS